MDKFDKYDEYDKYGFNKYWMHKDTGTRWDTLGFNKNGTMHKDTHTSKDKFGHRREYYSVEGICQYSIILLNNLFLNAALLNFDGEEFIDVRLNYKNISKIELSSFDVEIKTNHMDTRPKKLNGAPDYRYKSIGVSSTHYTTSYKIVYRTKEQSKKVSFQYTSKENLLKSNLEKSIEKYNLFLSSLKNPEFSNLYEEFLYIKERCKAGVKETSKLKLQKNKKANIYNKLVTHKDKFTEEQYRKFENLKQEIEAISSKIDKEENFKKDFDDIYKKLETQTKTIEKNLSNNKIDDEIDDLFNQLK